MSLFTSQSPRGIFSGYDNLINWPDSVNRPSISGNTLSWVGPVGGGVSTTGDSFQSILLTSSAGVTTSADNQIIQGLNIQGQVNINHNGVVVRNCRIKFLNTNFGPVKLASGITGVVIEDCEIDGASVDSTTNSNAGICSSTGNLNGIIVRRCNIHSVQNGINQTYTNCLVIDTWFHDAFGSDCDFIEVDAVTDGLIIQHNSFIGPVVSGFLNSGITPVNGIPPSFSTSGNVINMSIINCRFVDAGTFTGIIDSTQYGVGLLVIGMVNNGFYFTSGQAFRRGNATTPSNSGNFIMSSPSSITGSLCNGTGII